MTTHQKKKGCVFQFQQQKICEKTVILLPENKQPYWLSEAENLDLTILKSSPILEVFVVQ